MDRLLYCIWYGPKEKIKFFWRTRITKVAFRLRKGFWPDVTWNLDISAAKWLAPRLKHLKKSTHGYPKGLTEEEWNCHLDTMIATFEWIAAEGYWNTEDAKTLQQRTEEAQRGLELFAKYYMGLWD